MKEAFKEYHQFTGDEFRELWKDCIFVLDTNTLLNMYRYSRETVKTYFEILNELKSKKQLWIPYQVGYEFYENRIDVISEYEKSYDEILSIISKAKSDVETKYKNHPFLDLSEIKEEMNKGLQSVEKKINQAKEDHPKWLKNDEVLEKINNLLVNSVGIKYDDKKLEEIKKEGAVRYEKKIPPGFKDEKKDDDKKFGDLILWYQIIDKAKKEKKPIILISSDVKEDWWLEKNGKRLMPLPQLKKEMLDKAKVVFHIYTADNFLELSKPEKPVGRHIIKEVKMIRELEEERMMQRRIFIERGRNLIHEIPGKYLMETDHLFINLEGLASEISKLEIETGDKDELGALLQRINIFRRRIAHGEIERMTFIRLQRCSRELSFLLEKICGYANIERELLLKIREYVDRLEYLNQRIKKYVQ